MSDPPPETLNRREVLARLGAVTAAPVGTIAAPSSFRRVRPGEAGWPMAADWAALSHAAGGRLAPVAVPRLDPAEAPGLVSNPYFLRDEPGLTQSSGWFDAWRSQPSAYVVRARDAADVSAAVRFATKHRLRLVVKGAGHSYVGGSNAPDSLLVWTRDMEAITLHAGFVPAGSAADAMPAVSVGAGCTWGQVYEAATTRGGRYVQGGGCTTVGVAGLVLGGGFGSFSKAYGLAAASLLEAEVVTADGVVRTVNEQQEPDLFWALKGGGGGSFAVVTRLTLKTHDLPATFGRVSWSVQATSDAAFATLLERFVDLYADRLFNPHWGEQARAQPDNRFEALMVFQGLDGDAARRAWQPLVAFVADHPADYRVEAPLLVATLPARHLWDEAVLRETFPAFIAIDRRPGAQAGDWWWAGNTAEAGTFWHAYQSAWLPASLLEPSERTRLARAWLEASRHFATTLHFNKGLAGAPAAVVAAARGTAINPQVLDAFALAITAKGGRSAYLSPPSSDPVDMRDDAARVRAAGEALRKAVPNGGSYLSESDYFLANWQEAAWGAHWSRLDDIKRRYDPDGLFIVHHGVGSQRWSPDGFMRLD